MLRSFLSSVRSALVARALPRAVSRVVWGHCSASLFPGLRRSPRARLSGTLEYWAWVIPAWVPAPISTRLSLVLRFCGVAVAPR